MDGDININYQLYKYDINNTLNNLKNHNVILNKNQINKLIIFLESFFLLIDNAIFERENLNYVLGDSSYIISPSYSRLSIVKYVLSKNKKNVEDIINSHSQLLDINCKSKLEYINKIITVSIQLNDCYYQLLSNLCYENIKRMIIHNMMNLQKLNVIIAYKVYKINYLEDKGKIFTFFINDSVKIKELLLKSPITQNYNIKNKTTGKLWEKVYKKLEIYL